MQKVIGIIKVITPPDNKNVEVKKWKEYLIN